MDFRSPNQFSPIARATDQVQIDAGLRQYMLSIYNYMASGLAISGVTAWLVAHVASLQAIFFHAVSYNDQTMLAPTGLGWLAILAPLGIVMFGSFRARNLQVSTIQTLYWVFVALQGVSLSVLFQIYTSTSIVRVLFITAAAFAGLSLYGYTTRRNLTAMGSFLIMGLWGIIIASIVSIFWAAPALQFVITVVGVLIFAGLTAYQTQLLKEQYDEGYGRDILAKSAIFGAWNLYLNFINLMQFLLRLMGDRR